MSAAPHTLNTKKAKCILTHHTHNMQSACN